MKKRPRILGAFFLSASFSSFYINSSYQDSLWNLINLPLPAPLRAYYMVQHNQP